MKTELLLATLLVVGVACHQNRTYFVHSISAERWNKYVCESCKYNYHPVCGSNLKTYINPCRFSCEAQKAPGLTLLHRGECITRKYEDLSLYASGCPECRVEPQTLVCGSNEMTFYNVCYFECYRKQNALTHLSIAHTGPCFIDHEHHLKIQGETVTCICNKETHQGIFLKHQVPFRVKKVCGAITMYNKCQYDCEMTDPGFKQYPGICEDVEMHKHNVPEIKTNEYDPCLCPSNNSTVCSATYDRESHAQIRKNNCYASCEREHRVDMSRCLPKKCGCGTEYDPVCGMKLFKDVCHFECYKEIYRPGITIHGAVSCPKNHHAKTKVKIV